MLQGVGIAAFGMIKGMAMGALDAVKDFATGTVSAASDLREATALTAQVFEGATSTVEKFASSTKDAFSKSEAMQFAANFGTAFKSVGMELDDVAAKSMAMVTLAGDLGSAFNKSSEEAATALRSGLMGESEPMRRFGVFLSEAVVKAKAASMGMIALNGTLTDGQKVAARYAIIMEQTTDSQGMFGRDTESLADKQKLLDKNLEDLSAKIGTKLTPVLVDLATALNDVITQIDDLPDIDLGAFWDDLTKGAQDFIDTLPKSEYTLRKEAAALKEVDRLAHRMGDGFADLGDDSKTMGDKVGGSLLQIGKDGKTMAEKVGNAMDDLVSSVKKTKSDLDRLGGDVADALYDPIIAAAELATNKREQAEQRAVIASKKSTKEQVADAKGRLAELQKANLGLQLELLSAGKLSKKEQSALLTDLQKKWKTATGSAKREIELLINKIQELQNSSGVNITVKSSGRSGSRYQFAAGGYAPPYASAVVGEHNAEIVNFGSGGGYVNPSAAGGTGGGGGGMSLTINVSTPALTPGGAEELARHIAPSITRWQQDRRLLGAR